MAFLIGGANSAADTAFDVENSCRFNDGDYLSRTLGTPSSLTTSTFSAWVKLAKGTATGQYDNKLFFASGAGGCAGVLSIGGDTAAKIYLYHHDTGCSRAEASYIPTQAFRDYSAWMHIMVTTQTGDGTAADRMILYVNGVRVTAFDTQTTFDADETVYWNSTSQSQVHYIGKDFDGYLAEVVFCDGQAYGPTDFGEFDSNSPRIWKPKDPSGLTFGTNGFYLDFKDSANLGNDANGGTDWDETNIAAADQATDTPTNNFCTINPLIDSRIGFSEGNLALSFNVTDTQLRAGGTIGVSAGKWYWEQKVTSSGNTHYFGIKSADSALTSTAGVSGSPSMYYNNDGDKSYNTSSSGDSYGNTFTDNDIISVALDLDNSAIYFAKNGTWENSGDPTSGGTATGAAFSGTGSSDGFPSTQSYLPFVIGQKGGAAFTLAMNFGGCPAFTISSGNADGDGYGNFEYAVPSGYYALCTKNLGAYGG